MLDDRVALATALAMPNVGSRNGPTELEANRTDPAIGAALAARGHDLAWREMTSGLHAIALRCEASGAAPNPSRTAADLASRRCTLEGAVDPRREGLALGR